MIEILSILQNKILQYCNENRKNPDKITIVLAISGGVDSVVLANALNDIRKKLKFVLVLVHFNHGLQSNASEMERVCKKYSLKYQANLKIVNLQ